MRFDKWAVTAQEALQSSLTIAADAEAGQVKPIHLLKALLSSDERNLRAIIERVGADPAQVEAQVDDTIARQPKVTGDMTKMGISSELARVGDAAEKLASKMGDSYVTTEHLLCALADEHGDAGSALKGAGVTGKRVQEAYDDLRGDERVTSQDQKTQFESLEQYGRNVTDLARQGKLDPVIGRVEEIRRTIQVLSRRTKNNPVLIGEPGVGKTAIVEALAILGFVLAFVIRFASGWRVTALSSRPSNLRGKQGRVIIDEAAFHEQLSELLKAAMALLMWGGQVHIISTHDGVDNPFNELITDIRAGKKPYSIHRITFDEAVSDGLYRRICLRLGKEWTKEGEEAWCKEIRDFYGDDASEELDCIPKNGGGKWLNRALIESRMSPYTPVLRYSQTDDFALQPEHRRAAEVADWLSGSLQPLLDGLDKARDSFVGVDFARSGDKTAIVPFVRQQDLSLRVPFVMELGNMPFKQQEQICAYLLAGLPNLLGAALDARGNGQYLAEAMQDQFGGDRVQAVMLSEGWYRANTAPFKAALEDGTLDGLPRDEDILADLRAFELVRGVPRIPDARTKGQDGKKRHGDAAIAFVLAHYASRELNTGPIRVASRRIRRKSALTKGY